MDKIVDKQVVIMDLQGTSWSHVNMKFLLLMKNIADLDQAYYPEVLHRVFVINAPTIFTGISTFVTRI